MEIKLENTSLWPVTDWSAVGHAAEAVGREPEPLDALIRKYHKPLTVYLKFKFPWLGQDAELLITEFAEDRILKEKWLKKAEAEQGRFRNLLKTSLVHFIFDRHKKRDINREAGSLDDLAQELPAPAASDSFDLDWTKLLLAEVLKRMEQDCRAPGKDQPRRTYIWEIFQIRLIAPMMEGAKPWPYDRVVKHFQLRSPTEASNILLSAKRIFQRHLLAVIAEYEGQQTAPVELEELKQLLGRIAGKK